MEKNCIELNSQPVGMERLNKMIYVGCMDDTLKCFTSKVCGGILTLLHSERPKLYKKVLAILSAIGLK